MVARAKNPSTKTTLLIFVVLKKKVEHAKDIAVFGSCLYGQNWIFAFHECLVWVEELMDSIRNKQTFDRRGLRAMALIQQPL